MNLAPPPEPTCDARLDALFRAACDDLCNSYRVFRAHIAEIALRERDPLRAAAFARMAIDQFNLDRARIRHELHARAAATEH